MKKYTETDTKTIEKYNEEILDYLIKNNNLPGYDKGFISALPENMKYLPLSDKIYPIFLYTDEEYNNYMSIIANYNEQCKKRKIVQSSSFVYNKEKQYLDIFDVYIRYYNMPYKNIVEQVILHRVMNSKEIIFFKDLNKFNLNLNNILVFKDYKDIDKLSNIFKYDRYMNKYHQMYIVKNNYRVCYLVENKLKMPVIKYANNFIIEPICIRECPCCHNIFPVFPYNLDFNYCSQYCYNYYIRQCIYNKSLSNDSSENNNHESYYNSYYDFILYCNTENNRYLSKFYFTNDSIPKEYNAMDKFLSF